MNDMVNELLFQITVVDGKTVNLTGQIKISMEILKVDTY
jgi:hypothetical protein